MRVSHMTTALVLVLGVGACSGGKKEAAESGEARPEASGEARPAVSGEVVRLSVEDSALVARATVSDADARKAALAAVPGGAITAAELEEEDGLLIYSYDIKVGTQEGVEEVHVDATTGKVVKTEHEAEGGGEEG
jgi:uncharacterized membrane protein YkoI